MSSRDIHEQINEIRPFPPHDSLLGPLDERLRRPTGLRGGIRNNFRISLDLRYPNVKLATGIVLLLNSISLSFAFHVPNSFFDLYFGPVASENASLKSPPAAGGVFDVDRS